VEKILGDNEALPPEWVCDGTAGYEFAVAVNGLFVDPAGEAPLTAAYQRFTGRDEPFHDVAREGKRQILNSSLASELWALSHQLDRLARLDRRSRDFTLNGIRRGLREVIVNFPVYRSYVNGGASPTDKAAVGRAVHWARKRNPTLGKQLFDFIRDTVLLKDPPSGPATDEYRDLQRRFAGKFQQVTSPVTAKGVEDTALYVYNRLLSLNEVGSEPGRFGWPVERVHKFLAERGAAQPGGLCPLSTHDTKRSEDVRARLNVLSEVPDEWADAVRRWSELNRRHKTAGPDADPAPDANEEWLLYQTLVGVWEGLPAPPFVERIQAYMKKALCEAKVHSSWINPDTEYEAAVAEFVRKVLDPAESAAFLADIGSFAERVAFFGRLNALAQTVLRCTAPGVPDTYQGAEAWDLSLVDPDNRRPVDYAARAGWLADLDGHVARPHGPCRQALELSKKPADPRAKVFATARALRCRRAHAALFATGSYVPLAATGAHADHLFAFARVLGDEAAVVIVPRLVTKLVPEGNRPPLGRKVWGDTAVALPADVPPGAYRNAITGERLTLSAAPASAAELFGVFPAAVLVREASGAA
jgi:(1->4)-alpha-D-glucan 1-alpha-D-glucosylmutase